MKVPDDRRKAPKVLCAGCGHMVPYRGARIVQPDKFWHCPPCYHLAMLAKVRSGRRRK